MYRPTPLDAVSTLIASFRATGRTFWSKISPRKPSGWQIRKTKYFLSQLSAGGAPLGEARRGLCVGSRLVLTPTRQALSDPRKFQAAM